MTAPTPEETAALARSVVGLYAGMLDEEEREAVAQCPETRIDYSGPGGFLGLGKVVLAETPDA